MADLQALLQEVADAINTVPEQNATAGIPDTLNVPAIVVEPDYVDWTEGAMARGAEHWHLLVRVLLGIGLRAETQMARNAYLGSNRDIKDAIDATMPNAHVQSARKFDAWTFDNIDYLGVEIPVLVIA